MRLFASANYKFLQMRQTAYVVSAALIAIGLASIALHRGLNYGVDFTGGTLFQVRFNQTAAAADVRGALGDAGFTNLQVQDFGREGEFLIRLAEFTEGGDRELANRVDDTLSERFGQNSYTVVRTEAVGPKVGGELRQRPADAPLPGLSLRVEVRAGGDHRHGT